MNTYVDQLEGTPSLTPPATTIRRAESADEDALERLAQLEEKHPGSAPHLMAEQDGEVVATLSLVDDVALGDPFRPTADIVDLRVSARRWCKPDERAALRAAARGISLDPRGRLHTGRRLGARRRGVSIAGSPVRRNPQSKGLAITITCASETDACEGILDIRTARKIKPYSTEPARVASVGTFPFWIPPGEAAQVKGRVYGPTLAEAMLRGRVQLSVVARLGIPAAAGSRLVLFTYKRG